MKLTFIILQFNNECETFECIKSIHNVCSSEPRIIIVDNGSKKIDRKQFEDKLKGYRNIKFIYSENNLGFSKGNNLGYTEARKDNPDFVVVTNNDVEFISKDFDKQLERAYNRTRFDLLGPDIYVPSEDKHQNPIGFRFKSIDETVQWQNTLRKEIECYSRGEIPPKRNKGKGVKDIVINSSLGQLLRSMKYHVYKSREEILLHGACDVNGTKMYCVK